MHDGIQAQVDGWIQLGARGVIHHGFSCRNAEGEARWRPIVVDLTEESGQATMESLPEHNSHRCTRDSPTSRGCLRERGSRGGGEQAAAQGIATMLPQGVSGASEGGKQHSQQPAAQEAAGESSKLIVVDLTEEGDHFGSPRHYQEQSLIGTYHHVLQ